MKTAEETVQEFLFKDKPKRKYHNEFDVKDLVNLLQKFAIDYHEHQVKNNGLLGDVSKRKNKTYCPYPADGKLHKCDKNCNAC